MFEISDAIIVTGGLKDASYAQRSLSESEVLQKNQRYRRVDENFL